MSYREPTQALATSLSGENIACLLRSEGPIVSCVLLQTEQSAKAKTEHQPDDDEQLDEIKQCAGLVNDNTKSLNSTEVNKKTVLTHLVSQILIDTTPKKCIVAKILGGPFTFLGQYEDEGIVVMVRRTEDNGEERPNNVTQNPHKLQPPLHDVTVFGDILLMRVASTPEEDQRVDNEKKNPPNIGEYSKTGGIDKTGDVQKDILKKEENPDKLEAYDEGRTIMQSNEDFFLDYTKEEYIEFASRTDILPTEKDEENDFGVNHELGDANEFDNEEEDEDDEYTFGSDEDTDSDEDDSQICMMNLILGQLLKKFQEENGRGPNTNELLLMRAALAERLGIDCIPPVTDENGDTAIVNERGDQQNILEGTSHEPRSEPCDDDKTSTSGAKRKAPLKLLENDREKKVKFSDKDQVKIIEDDVSNAKENMNEPSISYKIPN